MVYDVFISYSKHDKVVADRICQILEDRGLHCWIAPRDIIPGADWAQSIAEAIDTFRVMVLIFSSSANRSHYVKREAERAVKKGSSIVPFRIEDVTPSKSLSFFLETHHWLDAFTPPYEQYAPRLMDAINILLKNETQESEKSEDDKGIKPKSARKTVFSSQIPQRNPNFTGREKALTDIHNRLVTEKVGASKQVITGIGGVGKTQLARIPLSLQERICGNLVDTC
jgi:hypothetical protein